VHRLLNSVWTSCLEIINTAHLVTSSFCRYPQCNILYIKQYWILTKKRNIYYTALHLSVTDSRLNWTVCLVRNIPYSLQFFSTEFQLRHPHCVQWTLIYRVIKKSLCTWWLQYRKLQVMFRVSPTNLQTFTDTPNCVLEDRVQYGMVTSRMYSVMAIKYFCVFCCTVIIRCSETFWSPCINILMWQCDGQYESQSVAITLADRSRLFQHKNISF
jgi:hypothetical protein